MTPEKNVPQYNTAIKKMLEGKGLIEETDMPMKMQIQAMASASHALDLYDVLDCKSIASHIKKGLFGCRILTTRMGVDGSVWWDPSLGAFSLTPKGASYISLYTLSTSSSSKLLLSDSDRDRGIRESVVGIGIVC
ncbi:hypothetical protein SASPL_139538 [Salvia splendens]|uniref:Dynein light chain n=1 Tax=Salvia splendens TaxID=180675 RepID=A0A8X8ZB29_SALSN|nr:hypothetical protein SASPL_139538 [Salvia splendens]